MAANNKKSKAKANPEKKSDPESKSTAETKSKEACNKDPCRCLLENLFSSYDEIAEANCLDDLSLEQILNSKEDIMENTDVLEVLQSVFFQDNNLKSKLAVKKDRIAAKQIQALLCYLIRRLYRSRKQPFVKCAVIYSYYIKRWDNGRTYPKATLWVNCECIEKRNNELIKLHCKNPDKSDFSVECENKCKVCVRQEAKDKPISTETYGNYKREAFNYLNDIFKEVLNKIHHHNSK